MSRRSRRALVPAFAAVAVALSACSGGDEPAPSPSSSAATPSPTPTRTGPPTDADKAARPSLIFGSGNVFTTDISRAPVYKRSAQQVKQLMAQITGNYDGQVAFNAHHYNSSLYVAAAGTPTVRVGYHNCQKKQGTPDGLYNGPKYFVDVPIPATAKPSTGTDAAMTIWRPSTDQLWELWVAQRTTSKGAVSWRACWGGRLDHVSKDRRAAFESPFGVSASGLATVGSMVTVEEAKALRIDHAVQLELIDIREQFAAYPANRSDGAVDDPDALMEGQRLRLPASVDVDSLPLTPLGKAVARAAQRYGFIVTDTAGSVAVVAESPKAQLAAGKPDPWDAIYQGVDEWKILDGFPWAKLEVVEPGYGAPAGTAKITKLW